VRCGAGGEVPGTQRGVASRGEAVMRDSKTRQVQAGRPGRHARAAARPRPNPAVRFTLRRNIIFPRRHVHDGMSSRDYRHGIR